jgi:16S rRNA (cytosine967-C5)-methyltransferase
VAAATAARAAALDALRAVRRGAFADVAFAAVADALEPRDRAFAQELVYGTLRLRGRLDHVLGHFSNRPVERLDPDILDVLRLGAYQLTELDGVPPYAAISQSVELVRFARAHGATGFVNGVLQSLRRAAGKWSFPSFDADPIAHLTTWGSHPRWLIERWIARFGAPATRRLVEVNNQRPQLYLRLLNGVEATQRRLDDAGIVSTPLAIAERAVAIAGDDVVRALDAAPVIVQDPAAGLIATFVDVPANARVLDVAAAPGGKALALAADRAGPFVVAADISFARMQGVRSNVQRLSRPAPAGLGGARVAMVVADARRPPFRAADVVLLDAPCTGTGTLRRHPDGRWRVQPDDLRSLVALQAELLDAAASIVAPGGLLVYATCSLEDEENEMQVTAFLTRHAHFVLEPGPVTDPALLQQDGTLRVLPQQFGYDGAFAARLRRGH